MTQPDFRALAQELVDAYVWCIKKYIHNIPEKDTLVLRAGAALATPPPEPPTDEALDSLWDEEAGYFNLYEEARIFARAVLERWGHV